MDVSYRGRPHPRPGRMLARISAILIPAAVMATHALTLEVDVEALINESTDTTPSCASCHGAQGLGVADLGAPMIAGLDAGYIGRVLTA